MTIVEFLSARYDEAEKNNAAHAETIAGVRTLADLAAKRAILDVHRMESWGSAEVTGCGICHEDYSWGPDLIEGPCSTVRLLAQPYADHPDFDPAWKVDA